MAQGSYVVCAACNSWLYTDRLRVSVDSPSWEGVKVGWGEVHVKSQEKLHTMPGDGCPSRTAGSGMPRGLSSQGRSHASRARMPPLPDTYRTLLLEVLDAVCKVGGDKAEELQRAVEPLQQMLRPTARHTQPDDPDAVLAKAFIAQAGVLRDLGQKKLQGEQWVNQARVSWKCRQPSCGKSRRTWLTRREKMDELTNQCSEQIVARQVEPYGHRPSKPDDMVLDAELQDQVKELHGAL